jgi:PAS domain S-box-containing protein
MNDQHSNSDERIDAFLDSLGEGLLEIGIDGRIRRANKSAETMLGISAARLAGQSALELSARFAAPEKLAGTVAEALEQADGVASGDCLFLHPQGKELYLSWVLSPLEFEGAARGRLLKLMDLTERHELRIALRHEREDFLAVMNHRLRTPLLAAGRIIELFLDGQFGKLTETQEQLISLLGDNVAEINRLMLMIMDIYRYRSATKALNLREIKVEALMSRLLADLPEGELVVDARIDCPSTVLLCDEIEVDCMLRHMVENAFRYARRTVRIQVEEKDCQIAISVEDDGRGIAEEDIKGLFDRFFLVSASGKYAPVTGAGLCLCSEIAKAHGGKIECKSVLGRGTRFEIRMPICRNGQGT